MVPIQAPAITFSVAVLLTRLTNGQITSDTSFYGQSPPVYPSPNAIGAGTWAQSHRKSKTFVSQMTLEEKSQLVSGVITQQNGCGGFIASIDRLGFPGLCLQDSSSGVHAAELVNSYPSGIHVGAR